MERPSRKMRVPNSLPSPDRRYSPSAERMWAWRRETVALTWGCVLPLEPQARAAQVDFVAGTQAFAATVAGGDFDGAAVAEDTRAEFAAIAGQAVLALLRADVGVAAGDGGIKRGVRPTARTTGTRGPDERPSRKMRVPNSLPSPDRRYSPSAERMWAWRRETVALTKGTPYRSNHRHARPR